MKRLERITTARAKRKQKRKENTMDKIDKTIRKWGKTYCDNVRACLGGNEERFRAHVAEVIGVKQKPKNVVKMLAK